MSYKDDPVFKLVKSLYKDDQGNPIELAEGQLEIFKVISQKTHPRVQVKCFTRYGKSLTVALAVLLRASTYPEKWAIVAGKKDKAKIIMNYINGHIFDSEYLAGRFRMDKGDSAEAIRRHRNKNHLTFDVGDKLLGEIFIASAKDALGYGAPNVIEDESALVDDNDHALVMRMIGDNPDDNFLCKIGNPFVRNHFLKSDLDPRYYNINVDCYQGIEEGRFTQEQLEELRQYSFFEILYENKFPDADAVDDKGWLALLTDDQVREAQARKLDPFGVKRLGVDVARGGRNYNVWVVRQENYAQVLHKDRDNDLMSVVGKTVQFMKDEGVFAKNVFIDDVGVGGGVVDRLKELGHEVNAIKEGARPEDRDEYANVKAEMYAGKEGLAHWVKSVGKLEPHEGWEELTRIRYKKDSRGRTRIEPKDDMRKRGEESPDVADALALTFAGKTHKDYTPPTPQQILEGGAGWDM